MSGGDLPVGWAVTALANLIGADGLFVDGDWVESKDQDPTGEVRLTQLADVGDGLWRDRSDRFLTRQRAAELNCSFLEPGDVLVARMPDPLGRACIFPGSTQPCVTVVDVAIVRPGASSVDPRWLAHWINAPQTRSAIAALQAGTTRKRISRSNLAGIELPVPPLMEQGRIVEAIDAALSKLEAGVAYMNAIRRRLVRLRAAVIARAVSGELLVEGEGLVSRAAEERPKHWLLTQLGDVTATQDYGTSAKTSAQVTDDDDVPVLRMGNIQNGRIEPRGLKYLPAKHPDFPAKLLAPGDVLFNRTNSPELVGKTAVYSGEPAVAGFASYLIRLRMTDDVLPDWVALYLNSWKGRSYMASVRTQQVGQANVNGTKLAAMQIAIPPLPEQELLLNEVSRFDTFIDACDRTIATQLNRAAALRRSTLRAAYSGHLVPQVPSEETASVLLERVSTLGQADRPQRSRTRRQSVERGAK